MNEKYFKLVLVTTTVVCVLTSIGCVVGCLITPLQFAVTAEPRQTKVAQAKRSVESEQLVPSLEDYETVWTKTLQYRRELDLETEFEELLKEEEGDASAITTELLGTIVEPGHSFAMFGQIGGRVETLGLGQMAKSLDEEFEVVDIAPRRVTIRFEGQLLDLEIAEENEG